MNLRAIFTTISDPLALAGKNIFSLVFYCTIIIQVLEVKGEREREREREREAHIDTRLPNAPRSVARHTQ
jgi:hypothetical protein